MLKQSLKASAIARFLGREMRGPDRDIHAPAPLEDASADAISFLANPKYIGQLADSRAGAVLIHPDLAGKAAKDAALILSPTPYLDFAQVLTLFAGRQGEFAGISPHAQIAGDAFLGDGCVVYPFVFIGPRTTIGENTVLFPGVYIGEDCVIGSGVTIYPNAVLMAETHVGEGCTIHAGTVLGADGFGFIPGRAGIEKIPQVGKVVIGDHVEIGANTTIDRAALGETRIGSGTKIDNLVQIGHNVHMGRDCLIVSQVGISGSTHVGSRVTMAGQAGVSGHLRIGDNVTIGPQSGLARDIPDNMTVGGAPAVDKGTFMRTVAVMPKLPDLFKRVNQMEKELETLKKALESATAGAAGETSS